MAYEYTAQNGQTRLDSFVLKMMRDVLADHATVKNHDTGFCCQVATSYERKVAAHEALVNAEKVAKSQGQPVFEAATYRQTNYIQGLARKCPMHLLSPAHRQVVESVQAQHEISSKDANEVLDAMISIVDGPQGSGDKRSMASTRLITPAQLGYLKKLLATRKHNYELDLANLGDLPFATAREMLDKLKEAPFAGTVDSVRKTAPVPEEGLYQVGDDVYKVQKAKANGSGHVYAKQMNLETGDFAYVGQKPFHLLTAANRMSVEEAGRYGKLYGKCIRCGRDLTDEFSIANGLGKVCITKF